MLAVLVVAAAILPLLYLPGLRFDNSLEMWLDQSSVQYERYQEFTNRYGSDEFILIALETDDAFGDESLGLQRKLARGAEQIDEVEQVFSLPSYLAMVWNGKAGWEEAGRPTEFIHNFLVGPDHRSAGVYITLRPQTGSANRQAAVEALERMAGRVCEGRTKPHLVGMPVLTMALNRAARRSSIVFMPFALAVCIIALVVSLRSLGATVAVMISIVVTSVWTMGLVAMTGTSLNMVTVALPAVLSVLALANGIHIASSFAMERLHSDDSRDAMGRTLRRLIKPAVFTSVTTAVGFGSLSLSGMQPIIQMGVFTAAGIMISCVCNLVVVPSLLIVFSKQRAEAVGTTPSHWSSRCGAFVSRRKLPVTAMSVAATLICLGISTQLSTESNALKFFPDGAQIVDDYAFVSENFSGFSTVEIDIECTQARLSETVEAMDRIDETIGRQPGVARIDHLGRLRRFSRYLAGSGQGRSAGAEKMLGRMQGRLVDRQEGVVRLRMSVLIKAMASSEFASVIEEIKQVAADEFGDEAKWHLTGIVPLLSIAEQQIVKTQIRCFPLAGGIVLLMIGLLFRSPRALAASVVPNLLPILIVLVLMVLLNVPLDPATVMIATIAIGIAADDTIHFLAQYKRYRSDGHNPASASAGALGEIGRAAVSTSLVAAGGFATLALSEFPPMTNFGLLTAVTLLAALLADIFVLPALCNLVHLWDID